MKSREHNEELFRLAVSKVRPDLLTKVGEAFAIACSRPQLQMAPDDIGALSPVKTQAVLAEISRLGWLGVQNQRIARVLDGDGKWVIERIDIGAAVRAAPDAWSPRPALSGAGSVRRPGEPVGRGQPGGVLAAA